MQLALERTNWLMSSLASGKNPKPESSLVSTAISLIALDSPNTRPN